MALWSKKALTLDHQLAKMKNIFSISHIVWCSSTLAIWQHCTEAYQCAPSPSSPAEQAFRMHLKLSNGVWLYMRPISYVDIVEWLYRQVLMTFLEFNPNNHTLPLAYNSCFSFGNHHVPVEIVCVFVCVTMKTHKSYRSDPLFQAHAVCMFGKRLTG